MDIVNFAGHAMDNAARIIRVGSKGRLGAQKHRFRAACRRWRSININSQKRLDKAVNETCVFPKGVRRTIYRPEQSGGRDCYTDNSLYTGTFLHSPVLLTDSILYPAGIRIRFRYRYSYAAFPTFPSRLPLSQLIFYILLSLSSAHKF